MSPDRKLPMVLLIFTAALAARLEFLAVRGVMSTPDTAEYRLLAHNLAAHHAFSMSVEPPLQPTIRRPPVYPLFLALMPAAGMMASAIAQAFLDSTACVLLFLMTSRVVRAPIAVATALLYAFHPGPVAASSTLLSEIVFTALLVTAALLAVMATERMSPSVALVSGVVFGVATLCRSMAILYLIAVACVLIALRFRRTALLLLLGAMVVITPWIARSSRLAGRFVLIQAPSFIDWYLPTLTSIDQNDEAAVWRYFSAVDPYGIRIESARTPAEVMRADDFGRAQAVVNLRKAPAAYLQGRMRAYPHLFLNTFDRFTGINRSLADTARAHDVPALGLKLALMLLFTALPMAAACFGLRSSRHSVPAAIAAVIWMATLAVHLPMWVEYRYWLPVLPFQLMTAALGIQSAIDRSQRSNPCSVRKRA